MSTVRAAGKRNSKESRKKTKGADPQATQSDLSCVGEEATPITTPRIPPPDEVPHRREGIIIEGTSQGPSNSQSKKPDNGRPSLVKIEYNDSFGSKSNIKSTLGPSRRQIYKTANTLLLDNLPPAKIFTNQEVFEAEKIVSMVQSYFTKFDADDSKFIDEFEMKELLTQLYIDFTGGAEQMDTKVVDDFMTSSDTKRQFSLAKLTNVLMPFFDFDVHILPSVQAKKKREAKIWKVISKTFDKYDDQKVGWLEQVRVRLYLIDIYNNYGHDDIEESVLDKIVSMGPKGSKKIEKKELGELTKPIFCDLTDQEVEEIVGFEDPCDSDEKYDLYEWGEEFWPSGDLWYTGPYNQAGLREGESSLYYESGRIRYEGFFKNDAYHGYGKEYSDTARKIVIYSGHWQSGLPHGSGTGYYPNGYKMYQGSTYAGLRSGEGTEYYPNGNKMYIGTYAAGLRLGHGTSFHESGIMGYEGSWSNSKFEGLGKCYYEHGALQYEGHWKSDQFHGYGNGYDSLGNKAYTGTFALGSKHGFGREFWSNGQVKYEGMWQYTRKNGKGLSFDINGKRIYKGIWVNDVKHGLGRLFFFLLNPKKGKLYNEEGFKLYDGEFILGVRTGKGKGYDEFGNKRYRGDFKNGKKHGKGTGYDESNYR